MENLSRRKLLASAGRGDGYGGDRRGALRRAGGPRSAPRSPTRRARRPRRRSSPIVRDAKRGEVTVMSGTERGHLPRPVLVKRLLKAAPKSERK